MVHKLAVGKWQRFPRFPLTASTIDGLNDCRGICAEDINAQPRTARLVGSCLAMVAMEFTEIQPLKMFALLASLSTHRRLKLLAAMNDNVKTFYVMVNTV